MKNGVLKSVKNTLRNKTMNLPKIRKAPNCRNCKHGIAISPMLVICDVDNKATDEIKSFLWDQQYKDDPVGTEFNPKYEDEAKLIEYLELDKDNCGCYYLGESERLRNDFGIVICDEYEEEK